MSNEKFTENGRRHARPRHNRIWKGVLWLLGLLLLVDVLLSWYWSQEPELRELPSRDNAVAGETIARELIFVADTLLSKPGVISVMTYSRIVFGWIICRPGNTVFWFKSVISPGCCVVT